MIIHLSIAAGVISLIKNFPVSKSYVCFSILRIQPLFFRLILDVQ